MGIRALAVVLFLFNAACAHAQSLDESALKKLSLDEEFYAVAGGHSISHPLGTANWEKKLKEIISRSNNDNQPTDEKITVAETQYPLKADGSEEAKKAFKALSGAYRFFRLENPNNDWFKNDRLPLRISELKKSIPIESQNNRCLDGSLKKNLDEIDRITHSSPQTLPLAKSNPSALQSRQEAVQFAKTLDLSKLMESPFVIPRSDKMAPFKNDMSRWPSNAKITRLIFHHSATKADISPEELQQLHFDRGWSDVGYHFGIYPDGRIVELRDMRFQGANAKDNNEDSIGIVFFGNYHQRVIAPGTNRHNPTGFTSASTEAPSDAAIQSAMALSRSLMNPESQWSKRIHDLGLKLEIQQIIGHTQCVATTCPGEAGLPVVEAIRNRLLETKATNGEDKK